MDFLTAISAISGILGIIGFAWNAAVLVGGRWRNHPRPTSGAPAHPDLYSGTLPIPYSAPADPIPYSAPQKERHVPDIIVWWTVLASGLSFGSLLAYAAVGQESPASVVSGAVGSCGFFVAAVAATLWALMVRSRPMTLTAGLALVAFVAGAFVVGSDRVWVALAGAVLALAALLVLPIILVNDWRRRTSKGEVRIASE
jgi:hypothetical protein